MDKFKDEELEFLAQENKTENEVKGNNLLDKRANVFSDVKKTATVKKKIDKNKDDFNVDDYLDKQSLRRMNIGLWLSENRKNIIKAIVVLLILISAAFFIYSVYNLVIYLKAGNPADDLINNDLVRNQNQIQPLVLSEVKILPNNFKNDLAISVNNNNPRFYANFEYCFKKGELEVSCGQNFILPNSEKYILAFGVETLSGGENFSFSVSEISWQRIPREIINYQSFHDERLNFDIHDINFKPATSRASVNIDLNSLEFSFENVSPYSYYAVPLNILLLNGDELKGVNRFIINDFYTGETRRVNLTWTSDLRETKRTLILPEINIFEEDVFLKYRGN